MNRNLKKQQRIVEIEQKWNFKQNSFERENGKNRHTREIYINIKNSKKDFELLTTADMYITVQ
jgi:hypothetical protein